MLSVVDAYMVCGLLRLCRGLRIVERYRCRYYCVKIRTLKTRLIQYTQSVSQLVALALTVALTVTLTVRRERHG